MGTDALAVGHGDVERRQILVGPNSHLPIRVMLRKGGAEALVLGGHRLLPDPYPVDRARDAHSSPAPETGKRSLAEPCSGWRQPLWVSHANGDATGTIEPAYVLVHDVDLQHVVAGGRRRIDVQGREDTFAGIHGSGELRAGSLRQVDAPVGNQPAIGEPDRRLLLQTRRPALGSFVANAKVEV